MSLFATKSIEQLKIEAQETGEHSLKRVLGPVNLVSLGIGAIIGTGIFVLTGQAAAAYAGPAIVVDKVEDDVLVNLDGAIFDDKPNWRPINP